MGKKKIIACLDNKNGKVVKGIKFRDIKELGDPVELAMKYEKAGVDQLAFYDISASVEGRTLFLDLLKKVTECTTVPVNAAGGIMTIEDCEKVFEAGASMVSINSGAIVNPQFVKEASKTFGRKKITVSVDIGKVQNTYKVFTSAGQKDTGLDAMDWIKKMDDYGAGNFIINSIDCDGVQQGYNLELLKKITEITDVPVTASGGAGSIEDFVQLFQQVPKVDLALAASIFHYNQVDIRELKETLRERGVIL